MSEYSSQAPPLMIYFSAGNTRIARLIRRASGASYAHVAVGYAGWVLNLDLAGGEFLIPTTAYLWMPRVRCCLTVPVVGPPLPPFRPDERPVRLLPPLIRHLTGGRWPRRTRDCVSIAAHWLALAGHRVPPRTTTAVQLHRWLIQEGHPHARISGEAEPSCGHPERGPGAGGGGPR